MKKRIECSSRFIKDIIKTLIDFGYVDLKEGTYYMLKLNKKSLKILKSEMKVLFKLNESEEEVMLNKDLFNVLRNWRKDKALKEGIKANTKYQIYKVNKDGSETKVVQQYSNGNKLVDIDTFVTDESGEIMTVKALKSGQYKIYEIDSASGLVIKDEFIDVTIGSGNPNYTSLLTL